MEHFKKYWGVYVLAAAAIIIIAMNWKKWFPSDSGVPSNLARFMCTGDCRGGFAGGASGYAKRCCKTA